MPSNHLIPCHPLLILHSIFPSVRVFSNESVLLIRWPKYWSFSFIVSPSKEYSELISFRINWFDLLEVQGTLKSSPTPQFKSINSLALSFLWASLLAQNPLQCSFLENPRDGGAWWADVYGVTLSQTRLKWLSSSTTAAAGSDVKESTCDVGYLGLILRLVRSPGEGNGYPLKCYGLENSMRLYSPWDCKESDTTKWLSCSAFFMVQLSHPYMTTGKTIALTKWSFVGQVISLLFNRWVGLS